jgi:integrase
VRLKDPGAGLAFTRKNGRPITTFRKRWHSAVRALGVPDRVVKRRRKDGTVVERRLPGLLAHDFRRTAVRRLERAGVARAVAMKLVGHKTESIYRRYAIVSESDLREAVEKLGAVTAAGS